MENFYSQDVLDRARALYEQPLMTLVHEAHSVHMQHHDPNAIQLCTLSSIKTGACPENCAYCAQSGHHKTKVQVTALLSAEEIVRQARVAQENGSSRFCMGASWRDLPNASLQTVKEIIQAVAALGLEVCCTLGGLSADQARELAAAGLHTYNHNIDTSPEFYGQIVGTHTFTDRMNTLRHVRDAGIRVCSGGILGMGESPIDRLRMLAVLASMPQPPESVPINLLMPMEGTPLADRPALETVELIRIIAVARILMPRSVVRLSAGRVMLSVVEQAFCFFSGANSIHTGDRLLTAQNHGTDNDQAMLTALGMHAMTVPSRKRYD